MNVQTSYPNWRHNISVKLTWIVITILALYASTAAVRVVTNTFAENGNVDFHSYWYDGVLIRYGLNSFESNLATVPPPSVEYIGGIRDKVPTFKRLSLGTANPALGALLFSLLGNFHWDTAKILWLIVNLISAAAVPLLIFRLLPYETKLKLETKLLIALAFFILLPLRNAIGNGQLTIFTLFIMLLAILMARYNQWFAGVALAGALIKFSVGAPLVLFFLYFRQWRPVFVATVLHFAGIVIYSFATNTPIDILIGQHIGVLLLWRVQLGDQGIALTSLLPIGTIFSSLTLLIMSAITGFMLLRWYQPIRRLHPPDFRLVSLCIFSLMTLYITLAIYHSYYDSLIIGVFFALLMYTLSISNNPLRLSSRQKVLLQGFLVISLLVFSVPGTVLTAIFEGETLAFWLHSIKVSGTIFLLIAYIVLIWATKRLLEISSSVE